MPAPAAYRPDSLSGPYRRLIASGMTHLVAGFPLRCFQRLSLPDLDTRHLLLAEQPVSQRSVHLGPLVLKAAPLSHPTPITDRDRTVSRRSEPSSRTEVPNFPVDVNSWGKSACYPRSTFCPLSDGPSTRNRQITKTCFRTCSDCHPRSQAPLCLYTRALIPNQGEGTFARLRYRLGGDRPSQTACLTLSAHQLHGRALETPPARAGISPSPLRRLTPTLLWLPAILHMAGRVPTSSCGEGSRGLSV